MSVIQCMSRFWRDETAATTIEYGLMASLIAAAAIPVMSGVGGRMSTTFSKLHNAMQDAPPVADGAAAASRAASSAPQ